MSDMFIGFALALHVACMMTMLTIMFGPRPHSPDPGVVLWSYRMRMWIVAICGCTEAAMFTATLLVLAP